MKNVSGKYHIVPMQENLTEILVYIQQYTFKCQNITHFGLLSQFSSYDLPLTSVVVVRWRDISRKCAKDVRELRQKRSYIVTPGRCRKSEFGLHLEYIQKFRSDFT